MPTKLELVEQGLLNLESHLCRPLDADEMELMTGLLLHENQFPAELEAHLMTQPAIKVMVSRLEAVNAPVSFALIGFLAHLCDSFGKVAMWVYTVAWMVERSNGNKLTLADWTSFFPNGVPTEEAYEQAWLSQKVEREPPKSDNAYDDIEYYPILNS